MDVYWSHLYPDNLYVHVGENDLRRIDSDGRMFQTVWFENDHFVYDEIYQYYGFEFIGSIEPEDK